MKRLLIATACSLYWIAPASAQTCFGAGSFANGPIQGALAGEFASHSKAFIGAIGGGSDSLFFKGGLRHDSFSDIDLGSNTYFFSVGGEMPVDSAKKILVCPVAGLGHTSGPEVGDTKFSSNSFDLGGNVGFVATKVGQADVVPTFGLTLQRTKGKAKTEIGSRTIEDKFPAEWFGVLDLGAGFIFNQRMAIIPMILIPFSLEDAENSFLITFSINFGS